MMPRFAIRRARYPIGGRRSAAVRKSEDRHIEPHRDQSAARFDARCETSEPSNPTTMTFEVADMASSCLPWVAPVRPHAHYTCGDYSSILLRVAGERTARAPPGRAQGVKTMRAATRPRLDVCDRLVHARRAGGSRDYAWSCPPRGARRPRAVDPGADDRADDRDAVEHRLEDRQLHIVLGRECHEDERAAATSERYACSNDSG